MCVAQTQRAVRQEAQLAVAVCEASTTDRPEESADNVLRPSICSLEDHARCPCAFGIRPCYWSSSGSTDPTSTDWITLSLAHTYHLISSVHIKPYEAWWQQDWPTEMGEPPLARAPVYTPRNVYLEFGEWREGWLWAASGEAHEMAHSSEALELTFARPLLVMGSFVRVYFVGKHQQVRH